MENDKSISINRFGKNLREQRVRRCLTRESFAELIGVSTRMVYDYESGVKHPSLPTLLAIREVLNCPLDTLFG